MKRSLKKEIRRKKQFTTRPQKLLSSKRIVPRKANIAKRIGTPMDRFACFDLTALTWFSELLCLVLTVIYSVIVFSDIQAGSAHFSSPLWFENGFCLWRYNAFLDSHTLCFGVDVLLGGILLNWNAKRYLEDANPSPGLGIATAISVFTMLHGFGHLAIHFFPQFASSADSSQTSLTILLKFFGMLGFLAAAPFVGYTIGVPYQLCVASHIIQVLIFVFYVPQQFAFGAVQLILNLWVCLPRLLLIGTKTDEDVMKRVGDGWAIASIGILLVMSVVFAEMLCCGATLEVWGGHIYYDLSTGLLAVVHSFSVGRVPNVHVGAKKDD